MNPLDARDRIVQFNNLYVRYVDAQYAGRLEEANRTLMDMAQASGAVQADLDRVNLGIYTLMDAPAMGGQHYQSPLVGVVLTNLAEKYNIDPTEIQTVLHRAIGEYERMEESPQSNLPAIAHGTSTRAIVAVVVAFLGIVASLITIFQFIGTPF